MTCVCVVVGCLFTCWIPVYLLNKGVPVLKKCICLKNVPVCRKPTRLKQVYPVSWTPGLGRAPGRARTWAPDTWEESASKTTP